MNQEQINIIAKMFEIAVERKNVEEALESSEIDEFVNKNISSKSTEGVKPYLKEQLKEYISEINHEDDLFLVKKIMCDEEQIEDIAEAVSDKPNDKFKQVKIIGSSFVQNIIGYKHERNGIETYLVSGKNMRDAINKTKTNDPQLYSNASHMDAEKIRKLDQIMTDAVYYHTPEKVKVFLDSISDM